MKHRDILNIIPEQFKGQELEAEASHDFTTMNN